MTPEQFIAELEKLRFENTFNPYVDRFPAHDLQDAASRRSKTLQKILEAAIDREIESIWIGRDLSHCGGRRTGLAFTDDVRIQQHAERWKISVQRATCGKCVEENSAKIVWKLLSCIKDNIFLWNVFPLHPHKPDYPLSNRRHNSKERDAGEKLLCELINMLEPQRLIAVGRDAQKSANCLRGEREVQYVRHPSHGGRHKFSEQIRELYSLQAARIGWGKDMNRPDMARYAPASRADTNGYPPVLPGAPAPVTNHCDRPGPHGG